MRLKRKSKKTDQSQRLLLSEIIGLTTANASGLASNISTRDCVYFAGCVVVVFNVDSGSQDHLTMTSRAPKPLSCVAVSHHNGFFIAAGESGHQPAVLIWDYSNRSLLTELKGHQYGVSCIDFSPDGKYLVSAGFPHDGYICLWNWQSRQLITKVRASSAIFSISFSFDGSFFITAGKKHLKFWMVGSSVRHRSNTVNGTLSFDGKPANLGCQKGSSFTSVVSVASMMPGTDQSTALYPIYALTESGVLCLLHSEFSLTKWVDLKVGKGFALSLSDSLIACACSNGIVRLFMVESLKYVGSLPYAETSGHLMAADVTLCENFSLTKLENAITFPDAIACQFSSLHKLVVVYGDHSLHVWDVQDIPKVTRCRVLFSHSACIWDVKNLPSQSKSNPSLSCVDRGCYGGLSFATCSADGTIRLWDIKLQSGSEKHATELVGTINLVTTSELATVESGAAAQGFRTMGVSSDGKYLAAGDCHGNLHVYNLYTSDYASFQEAHDAEILSLSFSSPNNKSMRPKSEELYLLASGGRDRMIHVYDVKRGFDLVESLDDHSASVTSVKFTCNGSKLLSCSADRSVLFRDVAVTDVGWRISRCHHQIASHGTIYDMAIDSLMAVAVTVGQDKKIKTFDLAAGKLIRTFKQDRDFGDPIKVSIDPSGSYLVCSYSNKSLCIYSFINGELVTQATGHAEVVTGIIFLPDCKHIISVSGDSCIFVWKVPALLSNAMLQKVMEHSGSQSPANSSLSVVPAHVFLHEEDCHQPKAISKDLSLGCESKQQSGQGGFVEGGFEGTSVFKFSASRLPGWAQNKVTNVEAFPEDPGFIQSQKVESECWSTPLDSNGRTSASFVGCAEFCTPCQVNIRGAKVSHSSTSGSSFRPLANKSSPRGQEILSTFAMGRQWNTIHTVLLNALDSPVVNDAKDDMAPFSIPNLGSDLDGPQCVESIETKSGDLTATNHPSMQSTREPLNDKAAHDEYGSKLAGQIMKDDGESGDGSCEGDDLFSQHFSNLSTTMKLTGWESSARRSLSSRLVVCRDSYTVCQDLFKMPMYNCHFEGLTAIDNASVDPSLRLLTEPQPPEIWHQDCGNSAGHPMDEKSEGNQMQAMDEQREDNQRQAMNEHGESRERIAECEAALCSLDAAAERAIKLFTGLQILVAGNEISGESRAELSDRAAELLPAIMEKVQGLSDLVQGVGSSQRKPCTEIRAVNFDLEPLVERFAERLSSQVLELVKQNL